MTRDGFRNVSLKEKTHAKLTEVANILNKSRPDTIDLLATSFLSTHETNKKTREVQERPS